MANRKKKGERKKFSDLTKQEAAVAIAEDVIAQIRAQRYVALSGLQYFPAWFRGRGDPSEAQKRIDTYRSAGGRILGELDAVERRCYVCAIGAGVLSACGLFDGRFTKRIAYGLVESPDVLKDVLGTPAARAIEAAFEDSNWKDLRAAIWGRRWADDSDRLEAIWTNVAKNEGRFDYDWTPSRRTRLGKAMKD